MWEARATYNDGSEYDAFFEDDGRSENDQIYDLECMLIERKEGCTWYSVDWVY